ncbi:unnamed protein product [Leuciscus chuanchicus]
MQESFHDNIRVQHPGTSENTHTHTRCLGKKIHNLEGTIMLHFIFKETYNLTRLRYYKMHYNEDVATTMNLQSRTSLLDYRVCRENIPGNSLQETQEHMLLTGFGTSSICEKLSDLQPAATTPPHPPPASTPLMLPPQSPFNAMFPLCAMGVPVHPGPRCQDTHSAPHALAAKHSTLPTTVLSTPEDYKLKDPHHLHFSAKHLTLLTLRAANLLDYLTNT